MSEVQVNNICFNVINKINCDIQKMKLNSNEEQEKYTSQRSSINTTRTVTSDNGRKQNTQLSTNSFTTMSTLKTIPTINTNETSNSFNTSPKNTDPLYNVNSLPNITLVDSIVKILTEIIDNTQSSKKSIFDNELIPKISIKDYLIRIMKYCKINKSTLVLSLVLIDRIPENFIISLYNIHKIILVSLLIACKINEDKIHTNLYFSRVGGINLFEMNLIEIDMLSLINYNMFVDGEIYHEYDIHVLDNVKK